MNQKQLDLMYLKMAFLVSKESYCKRLQVGAILVKDDIVFLGFNGNLPGEPNVCEITKPDGTLETLPTVRHAERNALDKIAKSTLSSKGATVYITHSPCLECAASLINAGIIRLVYANDYRDQAPIELLKRHIEVNKYILKEPFYD